MDNKIKHHSKAEVIVYIVVWAIQFLTPLLILYVIHTTNDTDYHKYIHGLCHVWLVLLIALIGFIVHDIFLASKLVYENKKRLYVIGTTALLGVFFLINVGMINNIHPKEPQPVHIEGRHMPPPPPPLPFHNVLLEAPCVMFLLAFSMTLGINTAVKFYFRNRKEHEILEEQKKERLNYELEYLKYQINPHFVMNTLNNIHALVDIDPERAKDSIVVLSYLLRCILYRAADYVRFDAMTRFVGNYITLMKLRYDEGMVDISFEHPPKGQYPNVKLPPLLLIPFVENAFKHGVSYNNRSFVNISVRVQQEHIIFVCVNSCYPQSGKRHDEKGIGIVNVEKRLKLLYGDQYKLNIGNQDNAYSVYLDIPALISTELLTTQDNNNQYDQMPGN